MTLLQLLQRIAPELSEPLTMASLYGSIALALLTCFFGFRLRQIWYALLVFAAGALLGYTAARLFVPEKLWLCMLIGLGAGLVAAAFTFRIYQAVVFALAFACVFAMVGSPSSPPWCWASSPACWRPGSITARSSSSPPSPAAGAPRRCSAGASRPSRAKPC